MHEPVAELVRDLKAAPGGDIGVHGSIELARSMLAQGLVDELRLLVGPTIGCGGRRLFAEGDGLRRLELLRASATPSSALLLTYRVPSTEG